MVLGWSADCFHPSAKKRVGTSEAIHEVARVNFIHSAAAGQLCPVAHCEMRASVSARNSTGILTVAVMVLPF